MRSHDPSGRYLAKNYKEQLCSDPFCNWPGESNSGPAGRHTMADPLGARGSDWLYR